MGEETTVENSPTMEQYSQILKYREKVKNLYGTFTKKRAEEYLGAAKQHLDEFIESSQVIAECGDGEIQVDITRYHFAGYHGAMRIVKKICKEWRKKENDSAGAEHEVVRLSDSEDNPLVVVAKKIPE